MEEILHQLVDGKHPLEIALLALVHRNPNSCQLMHDVFHAQYTLDKNYCCSNYEYCNYYYITTYYPLVI